MKKAACGRCGFQIQTTTALRSKHTNLIYCHDVTECDRRYRNELTLSEMTSINGHLLKGLRD